MARAHRPKAAADADGAPAPDAPTPADDRPAPDPPDPREPRPARPELLVAEAGRPDARRPRRPRALADATRSRTSPTPSSACSRRSTTTPARWDVAAASSAGSARGRGSATSPSTWPSSCRTWPAPRPATARPARPGRTGHYHVIYEYREEQVGLEAGRMAVRLVNHLVDPDDPEHAFDLEAEMERLIRLAERLAFGPSTQALVDEAVGARHPGAPPRPLLARPARPGRPPATDPGDDDEPDGRDRRRHRVGQEPHQPAALGGRPAGPAGRGRGDRGRGRRSGRAARLPGASSSRSTATTAAASGSNLRWTRPRSAPTSPRPSVRAAAATSSSRRTSPATTTAVLVIGGKLAAVAERVPASVTGDGEHTVRQLVETANADPRRGIGHEKVLTRITRRRRRPRRSSPSRASASTMSRRRGPASSSPSPATCRPAGPRSTGRWRPTRTTSRSPRRRPASSASTWPASTSSAPTSPSRSARPAAASSRSTPRPGFRMHTHPTEGEPQYVAKPVLDLLFPPGAPARIPIVAVTGTNGKTTTVRMIAHVLKLMGRRVGMTSTDGIVVDGRLIKKGDMSGPKSAQMVLQNPTVDMAVFEVARGGIVREGLGYDRNDVAVVTNVTGDHLGPRRHRHDPPAGLGQERRRRRRAEDGDRRPQRRRPARRADGPPVRTAASSTSAWRRRRGATAGTASTRTAGAAARPSSSSRTPTAR